MESKTGEVKLSNPEKDAKTSIQKQNKRRSNQANVLKKSPMNGMAIQSIFDGSERDENGKIKEDVMRLVRVVFDHFSRGRKTPVSSARKWRSDSSHRNEHGESEHQISVLTIQDFLRVARAARLVDHGKKNVRLPIDVTTLDMVYRRVNLQLRSEPHRMTFEAFQVALCESLGSSMYTFQNNGLKILKQIFTTMPVERTRKTRRL